MPTAPHPRNRLGLGIVVITIFACFAVELLELVIKGPTKDAVQSLSPVGLVAILASTIGWWLFASYDPEIPDAPRVRLSAPHRRVRSTGHAGRDRLPPKPSLLSASPLAPLAPPSSTFR